MKVANRATNFCLQPLLPNFVPKKIKASKYLLTLGFYIHADNQNFAQNIVTVHPFCIAAVRCDSKYGFFFLFFGFSFDLSSMKLKIPLQSRMTDCSCLDHLSRCDLLIKVFPIGVSHHPTSLMVCHSNLFKLSIAFLLSA